MKSMELYATGNNAWSQLTFEKTEDNLEEPIDLNSFQLVLKDPVLERPYASLACTLVNTSNGVRTAGFPEDWMHSQSLKDQILASLAAIAGNGAIAVYDGEAVKQYQSGLHFQQGKTQSVFTSLRDVSQLVAYETGFAALSTTGQVWTWGDGRYEACISREVSDTSPADEPATVPELEDLPTGKVKKLAAAGYLLMALTEGSDLYVWGGHPGLPGFLDDISASPSPVVIEDHDIADCAIGQSHAVVLTMSGGVYTAGTNANGQLGIATETDSPWVRVPFSPGPGGAITSVACGLRNSFVIVQKDSHHM
ncbi:RCC1/BLIP-II [Apiospora saccharicola]|uniref:RCC1/BLIP-II n=1 Tax=Apiospora saccharicola TaxID=335842 RepID=A0ABR1W1P1_9PEZI